MRKCLHYMVIHYAQNLVTADTWQLGYFTHEYTDILKVVTVVYIERLGLTFVLNCCYVVV
jgi:hypothetical protein